MELSRRKVLNAGLAAALVGASRAAGAKPGAGTGTEGAGAFDGGTVRRLAQELSRRPYAAPDEHLPAAVNAMDFDQYRGVRFRKEFALWHGQGLNFEVEFLPRGFLYRPRIALFEVADNRSAPLGYSPDLFTYEDPKLRVPDALGFAGFRIHAPLNRPDYLDEVCVFLGASYFRAVARGQEYGLSARGFADRTGDATRGEEFALFRSFWLEKPSPNTNSIVVHALLDGPSTTGAYRFTIRPGDETVFDVECTLYPRTAISESGIAPLTGMFFFDTNDRSRVDDARPAAHDSEGLSIWNARGEQIWRPLANPALLQFSAFSDATPKGFGLMQRKRAFADYQDLALDYQKRPSLWIEPIGDWGEGAVDLVELPTPNEVNDNIVAFWRPRAPLAAGGEYGWTYRMHWGWDNPWSTPLARVTATRIGATVDNKGRLVMIDFAGDALKPFGADARLHADPGAGAGEVRNVVVEPNPQAGGWRVLFEYYPGSAKLADLFCVLMNDSVPLSERWVYRWTP